MFSDGDQASVAIACYAGTSPASVAIASYAEASRVVRRKMFTTEQYTEIWRRERVFDPPSQESFGEACRMKREMVQEIWIKQ